MARRDRFGTKQSATAEGAVDTLTSMMSYIKQLVSDEKVVKTDGAVLNGLDPLFTITGGLVRARITGLVTEVIGGSANLRLRHITIAPSATVELNAGAVAVDTDNPGTIYFNIGSTGVFTPSSGLGFKIIDPVTVDEVYYLLAPGTVQCFGSADQSGVIAWTMNYEKCSPDSLVVAAA